MRGEWIEISKMRQPMTNGESPLMRGEWIEIAWW